MRPTYYFVLLAAATAVCSGNALSGETSVTKVALSDLVGSAVNVDEKRFLRSYKTVVEEDDDDDDVEDGSDSDEERGLFDFLGTVDKELASKREVLNELNNSVSKTILFRSWRDGWRSADDVEEFFQFAGAEKAKEIRKEWVAWVNANRGQ